MSIKTVKVPCHRGVSYIMSHVSCRTHVVLPVGNTRRPCVTYLLDCFTEYSLTHSSCVVHDVCVLFVSYFVG